MSGLLIEFPIFPRSVNNKWPAIIFAVKRTVNVIGRIKFLIDSIHTIKGIKARGVPCGTKWVNIWLVLLIHPKIKSLIQRGKAIVRFKVKCLVLVKIYGNNPIKLFSIMNINREIKIKVKLFLFLLFMITLNSLNKMFIILLYNKDLLFGMNQ